jgi:hypothetical protein
MSANFAPGFQSSPLGVKIKNWPHKIDPGILRLFSYNFSAVPARLLTILCIASVAGSEERKEMSLNLVSSQTCPPPLDPSKNVHMQNAGKCNFAGMEDDPLKLSLASETRERRV